MKVLPLLLLPAALALLPAVGRAQSAPTAEQLRRAEAARLLARSPLLLPRSSMASDQHYLREARTVAAAAPGELDTAAEATRALESLLAGSTVRAVVRSSPSRVTVTYRRLVDENAPELAVTTDDSVSLQPALYVFTATDPRTGQAAQQKKSCATGCTVVFRFR